MAKTCCFIGHRRVRDSADIRAQLLFLVEERIKFGYNRFIMGTHGEFDDLTLGVCRELRKKYPNILIEVAVTSLREIEPTIERDMIFGDEKYYPYQDVMTVMYEVEEEHYKRKIIASNRHMIDDSDLMICYVDINRKDGGAIRAYKYAKRQEIPIINLFGN